VGKILPGQNIVLVVASSAHRQAAFEAAAFVMDFLKSRAPFWKREFGTDGTAGGWVEARDADEARLRDWAITKN
jgi:molybdopterin synthase catalytic subunit